MLWHLEQKWMGFVKKFNIIFFRMRSKGFQFIVGGLGVDAGILLQCPRQAESLESAKIRNSQVSCAVKGKQLPDGDPLYSWYHIKISRCTNISGLHFVLTDSQNYHSRSSCSTKGPAASKVVLLKQYELNILKLFLSTDAFSELCVYVNFMPGQARMASNGLEQKTMRPWKFQHHIPKISENNLL